MPVSAMPPDAKRNGTFDTPPALVARLLDRATELLGDRHGLTALEPAAGTGAFLAGLARHPLARRIDRVVAIEPDAARAAECHRVLATASFTGTVLTESALGLTLPDVDLAIGNPPFVRFQHVAGTDARAGTANLWIRILHATIRHVRPGGVIAFVLPGELLSGVTSGPIRHWLLRHLEQVRVELVEPGEFPGVLVEVLLVSGRVAARPHEHGSFCLVDGDVQFEHRVPAGEQTWTRLLLPPHALATYQAARAHPAVVALGDVTRFELGIITGANEWFCVDESTVRRYELEPWAQPLLARARHSDGLRFTTDDHRALAARDERAYVLDFTRDPDPTTCPGALAYLEHGEATGIPRRYKCRIRSTWYRLPGMRASPLALAKRSNRFPYLVHNAAGAITTDTMYRGSTTDPILDDADLVAAFPSSLTLLSAEIEGRVLGGGALELVPSALQRLLVVRRPGLGATLPALDGLARRNHRVDVDDAVVDGCDRLVVSRVDLDPDLVAVLRAARNLLLARRRARPGA